jgi:tetratricopeptide (TPR) repeat protein
MMHAIHLAVALCVAASAPVPAGTGTAETEAAPSGPTQEAVDAFFRGRQLYSEARYEEALASFLEADRLFPAPDLQYNIGLCHERLRHWDEAIQAFEIYLRTKSDAADRQAVEGRIDRAKRERALELERANSTDPVSKPTRAADGTDGGGARAGRPFRPLVISGAVLLGAGGVAALGSTLGLGFAIGRRNDDLDEILSGGNPAAKSYDDAKSIESDAKRLVTYQYIAAGVSCAVALTGVALLAIGLKRRSVARRASSTALSPSVSPYGGGLVWRGKF